MAGFGGTVKLTGESEYRRALQQITVDLKNMSSALKSQTQDFSSNDKSIKNTANAQKQLVETIQKQQQSINVAKSSLSAYTVEMQKQTTIHNQLTKEYKNAVVELDRIKKTSGETSEEYKKQAEVVDKLEKELVDSQTKLDENKEAMSSLKKEINASQKVIDEAQKSLNNMDEELKNTEKDTKKAGDGFTVFKGILADLGSKAIVSALNGLKKLGGAMIDVGKQAISNFAEFEQLEGGVKKLFGDDVSKTVISNANKAFSTAGMSANQYLETVTSFSASLISDLGYDTKKAAEIADVAIRDMSDNANTFGTDIASIQYAYQGLTYSYN